MSRYLVVFNTCEIQKNNLGLYINGIQSLLNQTVWGFEYDIAVSGCAMHQATKAGLKKKFGSLLMTNYMDEILTVNVTFNKTVDEMIKRRGRYDGYIYVDSGVDVKNNTKALQEINDRAITKKFGIITLQTDTDMGKENWFQLPASHVWKDNDFLMPVGKCCNLHFNYFDDRIHQYYGKILPDIFRAYCTESVFSFVVAALRLQWVVVKDLVLEHLKSADGATAGFEHIGDKGYWNNLLCGLDMRDILNDPRAKSTGFGYDEWAKIFPHDPSKFDINGLALDPKLKEFIRESVYLPKRLFDYDKIKCETTI
jgi:hypothetical protein